MTYPILARMDSYGLDGPPIYTAYGQMDAALRAVLYLCAGPMSLPDWQYAVRRVIAEALGVEL